MKYACYAIFDQTWGYLANWDGEWTFSPKEALLFDSRGKADEARLCWAADGVEEVPDEEEFRNQPDTW